MRRLLAALAAFAACLGITGAAHADPGNNPVGQIGNVTSKPGQIQFLFSAGNLPAGAALDPKSVSVTVGGTALTATAATADAATSPKTTAVREVILALDVSGSMAGDGIAAARNAAKLYAVSLPSDVRVGLITFSDKVNVLLAPTADRAALRQAIAGVRAGGATTLYDALVTAAGALRGLPANAQRRLLVLSDGDDTSSTHSLTDALAALAGAKVAADVVAFRLPGNHQILNRLAASSGGRVLPAGSAGDLAGAFTAAAQEFQQQLLVTVQVPGSLAAQTATLVVAANAGAASVTASRTLQLPTAATVAIPHLTVTAPAVTMSNRLLWMVLGLAFAAILIAALAALFIPVMNHERARKQARLAEVHRYRVVSVVGSLEGPQGLMAAPSGQTELTRRALSFVDKTVRARGKRERLVSELDRAGLRIKPEEWAVLQVVAVIVPGVLLALLMGSVLGLLLGGVAGWLAARTFIRVKISRRANAFGDQLPDTLQLIASSLRTGFSLNQSLTSVVREGTEPTASEFTRALTEVRLGADLEDALDAVADRMKCEDLSWVVMAIRISREVGGNMAEVLGTTVHTMRQRAELRGQVRVLSAEGRISARILTALPFLVATALLIMRPGYLTPLFTQAPGIAMLVVGAVLLALGTFWLSRIVKIKV